jgi:hypothetical protein
MTSLSEIARNPPKALKDLEKSLGVEEGTLMREMQEFADEIGDWTQHIPYTLAATYYDSPRVRESYQPHVDSCAYCQRLLESLHPTDIASVEFARSAIRTQPPVPGTPKRVVSYAAVAASVLATAAASLFVVPRLQSAGLLPAPGSGSVEVVSTASLSEDQGTTNRTPLAQELRQQPNRLSQLQASNEPSERFLAAKYYFAADKPELAYQQLGEGLHIAGLRAVDAEQITAVADLPSDRSAATDITTAAQQLPRLQANTNSTDPADLLKIAKAQAQLGLHREALASIERYVQSQNAVDRRTLADFSSVAAVVP